MVEQTFKLLKTVSLKSILTPTTKLNLVQIKIDHLTSGAPLGHSTVETHHTHTHTCQIGSYNITSNNCLTVIVRKITALSPSGNYIITA